jgi:hypothetical protein
MANEKQVEIQISSPEHLPVFSGTGQVGRRSFSVP